MLLSYIIPFLILILVVVFIHEYGHYYFAKKYGVGVTDFSIGFGKELFGWNDKSGTRWKVCAIPLGGYVKFFGDRNVYSQADHKEILEKYSEEEREKLFILKPLYQRALIVFGGPLANFLLAIVIFFSIYTFVGKDFTPAVINEVQKDSPAMVGGLKEKDIILEIDGNEVKSFKDLIELSEQNKELKIKYELENNLRLVSIKDQKIEISFNSDLDKSFIKELSSKLLEWTNKRWIIAFSKENGLPTLKEQKNKLRADLLQNEKGSDFSKEIKKKFPDAELIGVEEVK